MRNCNAIGMRQNFSPHISEKTMIHGDVITPFGEGRVERVRSSDGILEVNLDNGARAFLNDESVERRKGLEEMTPEERMLASMRHVHLARRKLEERDWMGAEDEIRIAIIFCRKADSDTIVKNVSKEELLLELYIQNAKLALKLGEMENAIQMASFALDLEPARVDALLARSRAFRRVEKFKQSLEDIQLALSFAPFETEVQAEAASIREELKHETKLLVEFHDVFERNFERELSDSDSNESESSSVMRAEAGVLIAVSACLVAFYFAMKNSSSN